MKHNFLAMHHRMAEIFMYNIAESVLKKLGSLAVQEVILAWGLEADCEKLEEVLSTIKAVLLDAEQKQVKNHRIQDWLGKLRDVLCAAEDVLDDFECEALRRQVAANQGSTSRKVRGFFSSSNPVAFRLRMGHKIKKIRERIVEIASIKSSFELTEGVHDTSVEIREREMTHSFVHAEDVIGREADKEIIIEHLTENPSNGESLSVIPIVGIGGLGKTALAKLVYNDERVERYFELKMWICVSDDFNIKKLMEKIIKSAINSTTFGENYSSLEVDQLQRVMREQISEKKYFLVLDDVWNDDRTKWNELKELLRGCAYGSKIMVTTRSKVVASIVGTAPAYNLSGLPDDKCLSLFLRCAFNEGQEKLYPNLVKIGSEIVKKCGGVPLAVRTVGTQLFLKTDEADWNLVKESDIWELDQNPNDILPALRISYQQLPSYLKQCFASCSVFPKDYEFNSLKLIQFWMAHGLLQSPDQVQLPEYLGLKYLKELFSRCFFQDIEDCSFYFVFKMHDLVHDLAQSVAQRESLILKSGRHYSCKRVRHLTFFDPEVLSKDPRKLFHDLDHVQTILIAGVSKSLAQVCISGFQNLRVLDLAWSTFEVLPRSIGTLKHLRYLDLTNNVKIRRLPSSICNLQSLQTLILSGCEELEGLPRNMKCMISLSFLWITAKLRFLPSSRIGCLQSLRTLGIGGCGNLEHLFDDMIGLNLIALRTLVVGGCRNLIYLPHDIKYLTALENLTIATCENLDLLIDGDVVDNEHCGFKLKTLSLHELPLLVALPRWLLQWSACSLESIAIWRCHNLVMLPEWLQDFISLQKLDILGCPGLSSLPIGLHRLTSLRKLTVEDCPALAESCNPETGKDWPQIAHVSEIYLDGIKI
ncbi:putative disease resistance protein RGA1 [Ricinus communis]|uniref:putative disease resistance protein RGA1 n=1 Tax=Ricinus communis TaxID=3988 RepID=UPI00201A247C|nr:putative disease resistance protein RGA1 [Ricinus communis]XP_025014959.2 putative disease resistance protein RGA1 [Ricinus communis]